MSTAKISKSGPLLSLFSAMELDLAKVTRPAPELKRPIVGLVGKIGELAEAWLSEYPATTASAYLGDISTFVNFCSETGIDPLSARRVDLARFSASMSARGLSAASVARTISGVSSFYCYCTATGATDSSPIAGLRRPRRTGGIRLGLSADELARLLAAGASRGQETWCLAALMGTASLRVSAACGLRVGDIGRDAKSPIVQAIQKGGGREAVRVSAQLAAALCEVCEQRPKDAPMLTGPTGGWLTRQQAGRIIRSLGVLAGLNRPVTPHTLRHSFVSIALGDAGIPLPAVAAAACHRDPAVTISYSRALACGAINPAEAVAQLLANRTRQA